MMRTWWIDQSALLAGSNPGDAHLARLRERRFSLAVSLLDESRDPPKYDRRSAASAGWSIYRIPIDEGGVPSLVQVCEFAALMGALPRSTKTLVFCDSGLECSAFMGAVYWIGKGRAVADAIALIAGSAGMDPGQIAGGREEVLRRFAQLRWRI